MKLSVESSNVDDCFYSVLRDHKNYGVRQQIRGTSRYEILDYTIGLTDSRQNILFVPFRYSNLPAIIAETIWVFAGRDDMFFLKYYLKNAMKYSDDGEVWRGCFTGDTKISLCNGREVPLKKLVGKKLFYVYTFDHKTRRITVGKGRNCRKTGRKQTIIITLDNGETIKCTPDHKFLLLNGKYKRADKLTTEDQLMPLYRTTDTNKAYYGYEKLYQPILEEWQLTHRMVGEWKYGYRFIYHHKDLNIRNNSPSNLKAFDSHAEHRREHAKIGREIVAHKREEDEEFKRMTDEISRKNVARATKVFLKKFYNDPEYRKWARAYRRENIKKMDLDRVAAINKRRARKRLAKLMKQYGKKVEEYTEAGMTVQEIVDKIEISRYAINKIRRELGLVTKTKEQKRNHKIIKIEQGKIEDVYDIEVEGTHNFALTAGVFVHNSYGTRLRNYATFLDNGLQGKIDKIDNAIIYLKHDPPTTRGVFVIPDGKDYQLDEDEEEKIDEPCTMFVQYIMRGGELHCFVRMRSNDVILGCFNVNLFEWTFLQQLIANELHTAIGTYNVNAVSMHIYSNWMKKLPLMLAGQLPISIHNIIEPTKLEISWSTFKKEINRLLEFELLLRGTNFRIEDPVQLLDKQNFSTDMRDIMLAMTVSMTIKKKIPERLRAIFCNIRNKQWAIACMEFAARRLGSSYKGFIHHCLKESEICPTREAETAISDYIFHSFTEQEVIDKLNRVRR